jgi:hypothetical protein
VCLGADVADETSALPVRMGGSGVGELRDFTEASWGPTGLLGTEGGTVWGLGADFLQD